MDIKKLDQVLDQLESNLPKISKVTENYNDIVLTEEEKEYALKKAREEKYFRLERIKYHEKISKPVEYPKMNDNELFNYALSKCKEMVPDFVCDIHTNEIMTLLSLYFTESPQFEKDGRSLKKGIMLLGPLGCGKTTIMKAFAVNTHNAYVFSTCRKVSEKYAQGQKKTDENVGYDAIEEYSILVPVYPQLYYGQTMIGRCFDDLGTESIRKHFGNESNVMAEIIMNRYEKADLRNKTHFTGNLSGNEIGEFYGERVKSRLREMCNMITFSIDSQDRRI